MEQAPGLKRTFVIIEQGGNAFTIQPRTGKKSLLFSLRGKVKTAGWEEGLLGFAFSPDFRSSRKAYIYYSSAKPNRTILSRITLADLFSDQTKRLNEEVLLEQRQPFANHNGGMLAFGPDKLLYLGLGDGGSAGDPLDYGQHNDSLLGTIIRIDVETDKGYKIPPSNPFVNNPEIKPEIYAYGLRNPWRFSFDRRTGELYVGDVGQNRYEEISIVNRGDNLGWANMEGPACFKPKKNCKRDSKKPFHWYDHSIGSSIVGGYVYHGDAIPSLRGLYIFADTVSGVIFAINPVKPQKRITLIRTGMFIVSFSQDDEGELYFMEHKKGKIYKIANEIQLARP